MIGVAGKGISDETGDGGIARGRIDGPGVEGALAGRGANDGQTGCVGMGATGGTAGTSGSWGCDATTGGGCEAARAGVGCA